MRLRFKILFVLLYFSCIFCNHLSAQNNDSTVANVGLQPFLIQQGFRVDVEKRLGYSGHWLAGGIQYFSGLANENGKANVFSGSNEDGNGDSMHGYGFVLEHKIFLKPSAKSNIYIAYGPLYQHFDIPFSETAWRTIQKDDLDYYSYGKISGKQKITRYGGSLVLGKKLISEAKTKIRVSVDVYGGISYKKSIVTDSAPGYRDFTKISGDYAYSGFQSVYGVRLSFGFPAMKNK